MKVRADIAELLRAGVPQSHIARRLHVAPITVQRTREALRLPAPKTCRVLPATLEDAFRQHTRPTDGGHIEWTGRFNASAPTLIFQGTVHSAYQVAFRFHHGRDPVGKVTSCRSVKGCVAGPCLRDQPMRQREQQAAREQKRRERQLDRLYAGIFGRPA